MMAERGKKSLFRVGEPRKVMEEVGFERSLGGGLNFKEVRRKSLRMKKYCVAAGRLDFREGCLLESKWEVNLGTQTKSKCLSLYPPS